MFIYKIKSHIFDENYHPSDSTRITTNFANLARGEYRRQNVLHALRMINNSFNALAYWDNPKADRYTVELEIISVDIGIERECNTFPSIEVLKTNIVDQYKNERIEGIVGNNFSSYLRDYDFSVLLVEYNKHKPSFSIPDDFGILHGKLFKHFIKSDTYNRRFSKPPVICLSVAESKTYYRTQNQHPLLGFEYQPNEPSLTEQYFEKMGLQVRYFMPPNSVAPLAFYFIGDLLNDYSNLELISTISTMGTFQKIYRPEIYHANAVAGQCYKPSLQHQDHSTTRISYDREERNTLAGRQGKFAEDNFIKPYQTVLTQWSANCGL